MFHPRRLLAAITAVLALGTAAACGAPAPDQSAAPQEGGRIVDHAMGRTEVPGTPRRVVVLDTGELDAALALGVKPVGTVLPDVNSSLQPYLAEKAGDIEFVGTIGSPNLEKIAALKPDLILSSKVRDEQNYDALSKIAPTVFAETVGKPWKENFLLYAKALGKEAEAQRILDDYHERAADIGRQLGDPANTRVSTLRFLPGGLRMYGTGSYIGTILADVGLGRPDSQLVDKTFVEISREQLGQADGDLLFYAAYGDATEEKMNEVIDSVQWSSLTAVKNGKAIEVPDDTWFLGLGPIAANLVLDDLQEHLAPR
ncbi:ABC transporter substrate-binding protein [Saccharopolyspora rectivirgula]|jgi:iron complex transport system substrate-binding protein|uniref:DNA n=1 Tax=Saccharopolyspora rectivirgula TaxID=28042 RepID=I0JV81_9PSEU|nr:iron-siderophore ABC transporter substrate-binding protein [Saccharopolyspora rectivirgula]KEI45543.1 iron ABC transporter substrate-binding protein [Saccharopolyspora rectivirgula]CCG85348.1 DNA [Saccharopolyspora rectivirgula]